MSVAKEIEGYPDYYVSSAGNVWRKHRNEFYLRLRPSKKGLVALCINCKAKSMYVYRLVAMAFVPVPEKCTGTPIEELDVHHINFNHNDNRASNLQWLTKAEHKQLHSDSEVTFARKSDAHKGKLKGRPKPEGAGTPPKPVIQYTKEGVFVEEYASISEAERLTNIACQSIRSCCKGRYKSAGGFKWKYA